MVKTKLLKIVPKVNTDISFGSSNQWCQLELQLYYFFHFDIISQGGRMLFSLSAAKATLKQKSPL